MLPCTCPPAQTSFSSAHPLPSCFHNDIILLLSKPLIDEEPMPNVALRGMRPELHQALKRAAERSHRSLNGEILARLEASLRMPTVNVDALLARIEVRRARSSIPKLDTDELRALKQAGRP